MTIECTFPLLATFIISPFLKSIGFALLGSNMDVEVSYGYYFCKMLHAFLLEALCVMRTFLSETTGDVTSFDQTLSRVDSSHCKNRTSG